MPECVESETAAKKVLLICALSLSYLIGVVSHVTKAWQERVEESHHESSTESEQ